MSCLLHQFIGGYAYLVHIPSENFNCRNFYVSSWHFKSCGGLLWFESFTLWKRQLQKCIDTGANYFVYK